MDIENVKTGMFVECDRKVGLVLAVDREMGTILLEEQASHQQFTAEARELEENLQLHGGCHRYY
ncbi:hypothetical protein [Vibrio sonorensis]|uniref:hypothetical protein n=1 Tax=Vibrio sonorensis TaxID=1004316 RepID=UPI0008D8D832|nr:hypothetical protein [Vibrio sonorensis]